MRHRNQDEISEQLKEIINNYDRNPEYVNMFYTKQESIDDLNIKNKLRYIKFD